MGFIKGNRLVKLSALNRLKLSSNPALPASAALFTNVKLSSVPSSSISSKVRANDGSLLVSDKPDCLLFFGPNLLPDPGFLGSGNLPDPVGSGNLGSGNNLHDFCL